MSFPPRLHPDVNLNVHIWTEFQRLYTPTAFREERILWRAVIQLNIVRSIRTILDTLAVATLQTPQTSPMSSPRFHPNSMSKHPIPPVPQLPSGFIDWSNEAENSGERYDRPGRSPARAVRSHRRAPSETDMESDNDMISSNPSLATLSSAPFEALRQRLNPLRHVEQLLIAKLVPPNEDEATQLAGPSHSQHPPGPTSAMQPSFMGSTTNSSSYRNQEIFVRPGTGWKGALARNRVNYPGSGLWNNSNGSGSDASTHGFHRPNSAGNTGLETSDEPQEVLHSCRKEMIQLWNDESIREILRRKKIRLEEFPGL